MSEIAALDYQARLTLTIDATDYYWSITDQLDSGQWFDGRLTGYPTPSHSFPDLSGVMDFGTFDVTIATESLPAFTSIHDVDVSLQLEMVKTYGDGTTATETVDEQAIIVAWERTPGELTLTLASEDAKALDALYPATTYTVDEWPELYEGHVGMPIAEVIGTALKVPCPLIKTNSGSGPWVFGVKMQHAGTTTVLTVYRNGRIVDSSEYTVVSADAVSGWYVDAIQFTEEQVDFSGALYEIEADVYHLPTSYTRTPSSQVAYLLTQAGESISASSFSAADTIDTAAGLLVDYGYTSQREYRVLLEELLLIGRASLWKNSSGAWQITQDTTGSAVVTLDEGDGDLIQVDRVRSEQPPATVQIRYRPSGIDPTELTSLQSRSISGGNGVTTYDMPFLRDHSAADKVCDYLGKRLAANEQAEATIYGDIDTLELGEIATIDSAALYSGSKSWIARELGHIAGGMSVSFLEYDSSVYAYASGTLPSDAATGYQPDYSKTPPAAPTGLTVVDSGAEVAEDGHVTAWVEVKCTPPSTNWATIRFWVRNDATSEMYLGEGEDIGGGEYGCVIPGLRPGEAHTITAVAINTYGTVGTATSGVAHTSASDSTVPATPTGYAAAQGTGKFVNVSWTRSTDADYKETIVYRSTSAGGTYSEIGRATGTRLADQNVNYGSTYYYKMRHTDWSGNQSALSSYASASVSQIANGDMGTNSVNTTQIVAAAVSYHANGSAGSTTITGGTSPGNQLCSASFTSTGNELMIFGRIELTLAVPSGITGKVYAVLRRGSTVLRTEDVFEFGSNPAGSTLTFSVTDSSMGLDAPASGTYNYNLCAYKTGTGVTATATESSITVLELKR